MYRKKSRSFITIMPFMGSNLSIKCYNRDIEGSTLIGSDNTIWDNLNYIKIVYRSYIDD